MLLGGREIAATSASMPSASNQLNKVLSSQKKYRLWIAAWAGRVLNFAACSPGALQRLNFPHRVASLMRFREKRKERNFDKKIRYAVRKEVALR